MFKKIKELSTSLVIALSLGVTMPVLAPAVVSHANNVTSSLCEGITAAESDTGEGVKDEACLTDSGDVGKGGIQRIIKNVINLFSLIVGAVSVIMIIYGGFKYITSGGNDSNVGSAKSTIMYALIGLVIVALAQVIVRFVLSSATKA